MSTALAAARAKTKGKRMLRDALEGYGEDAFTLSEWSEKKRDAEKRGKWTWKQGVVNTNAAIKTRCEKDGVQDALKARIVGIQTAMEQEMAGVLHAKGGNRGQQDDESANQCCWRDRIGGEPYHCTNDLPVDTKKPAKSAAGSDSLPNQTETPHDVKRFCRWHARECDYAEHPMEKRRVIEIPNEFGLCLHCYEATATTQRATLQKAPPRIMAVKIPDVSVTNLRRDVQRDALLASQKNGGHGSRGSGGTTFTAKSICVWQKEHFEKAYIWRCSNRVLMHPTMSGSYLSFCGFHAPRCIKEYGRKSKKDQPCPSIDRLNGFGMCRNRLEAHMSTLNYEERGACVLVDSEFDVSGIKECSRDAVVAAITRHPLAPKHPPPPLRDQMTEVKGKRALLVAGSFVRLTATQTITGILDHPNPVSMLLKEAIWRIQFLRRARVVAIRVQRIFRGKRALRRIKACLVLQQFARGFLGRRRFQHEHENVNRAVPLIQRIMRGGLARERCREQRAAIRIEHNYRCYRQRLLAWAFREEMEFMKNLQREADENLRDMEEKLYAFRRLRAHYAMGEPALESVGALVERLRDGRKGFDLLADDRDFVDFVFRNSTLLKTTWLQVVAVIRYGTARNAHSSRKEQTTSPALSPTAFGFYTKEFGFIEANGDKVRVNETSDSSGYTIVSVQDHEFCPAVHEVNLVRATRDHKKTKKKKKTNRPDQKPQGSNDEEKEIVFIQVAALCRDDKNEDWVLGCAFYHHQVAENGSFQLEHRADVREVYFDERLVFTKLAHVIGAARIRHCSKSVFYRKFLKRGAAAAEATSSTPASSNPAAACSRDDGAFQERFWRRAHSSEVQDSEHVGKVPKSESGLIAAGNNTWKQYKSGVVSSCSSSQLDHAVLAVGLGGSSICTPRFKIKNSWGESGFIRLKRGVAGAGTCGIIGPESVYPVF